MINHLKQLSILRKKTSYYLIQIYNQVVWIVFHKRDDYM